MMERTWKTVTLHIVGGAKPVTIRALCMGALFVHKKTESRPWSVSHIKTGLSVLNGFSTRKEALLAAELFQTEDTREAWKDPQNEAYNNILRTRRNTIRATIS